MLQEPIKIEHNLDTLRGSFWVATFRSYDGPESPIGYGLTPTAALEMLLEMAGVEA